jgi:hypothetical protein
MQLPTTAMADQASLALPPRLVVKIGLQPRWVDMHRLNSRVFSLLPLPSPLDPQRALGLIASRLAHVSTFFIEFSLCVRQGRIA